jgi:hypothetical protein
MDLQRNMTNCVVHRIAGVVLTSTVSFVFCLVMRFKSENRKDRGKELVQKDIKRSARLHYIHATVVHSHMLENSWRTKVSFTCALPTFQNTEKNIS